MIAGMPMAKLIAAKNPKIASSLQPVAEVIATLPAIANDMPPPMHGSQDSEGERLSVEDLLP